MSKSIRIRTTPNSADKYIKVKLDSDFDFLEVLSLKITQEDVYRRFSSDYGVVAGRVTCNSGLGVPNVRISVFIPISDSDKDDPIISGIYPFTNVYDKTSDGVRYNLLPNKQQGICHTPIGTIPSKSEVLDSDEMLEIYDKYYKFTTITNNSGDYMIFGVPIGNHTIHMDADLSDIGYLSQRPYDMIRKGSNEKLFDSPTKFKEGLNLDTLVQVKSANTGVDVRPFWGDKTLYEVGISRADFDLGYYIEPTAIFIGSVFSDSDKHSVNKQCRPRKKTGDLCETVTSEGTIEMIRKTIDGGIERLDVEGGRVIDSDGAWAYQIPMNLDYKITDEFGNLVDSGEPSKGIATTAKVRFRISMDQTGGEGRLRTRASYLIPNNPNSDDKIDYNFDSKTLESSLYTLKFNKLYSVKNFISRYQTNKIANNRNFIGIKNVDDCGSRTPFPYNRIDTDFNPLYGIICTIIVNFSLIVYLINATIIGAINLSISGINIVLGFISDILTSITKFICHLAKKVKIRCGFGKIKIKEIDYIPCILIKCDSNPYAPGCWGKGLDETQSNNPESTVIVNKESYDECVSTNIGDALNVFEFDFFNDWINGTLYLPLIKYKKRRNNTIEKFCEYDCSDFDDNERKNDCNTFHIVDTCVGDSGIIKDSDATTNTFEIREGIVKKTDDGNFYYASVTHNNLNPMYMTDMILLGSILDNDYDNLPVIHESLQPTTYKMADSETQDGEEIGIKPLFFKEINCFDFKIGKNNCRNINLACELGVELGTDDTIGCNDSNDINDPINDINDINDRLIRRYIIGMNYLDENNVNVYTPSEYYNIDDKFGYNNDYYYRDLINSSDTTHKYDYFYYRGVENNRSGSLNLALGGSLYFYFGVIPGRSAIEKANMKYFVKCEKETIPDLIIDGTITYTTNNSSNDGTISINIIGGEIPFNLELYKDGVKVGITIPKFTRTHTYNNLDNNGNQCEYKVVVTETTGQLLKAEKTFIMKSIMPLTFSHEVVNSSSTSLSDGSISIYSVRGGIGPYKTYTNINDQHDLVNGQYMYDNLNIGTYTVHVIDSISNDVSKVINVTGPPALYLNIIKTDISCNGLTDGNIRLEISGDSKPYSILVTDSNTLHSTGYTTSNLSADTYNISVTGASGAIITSTTTLTEPSEVTLTYSIIPIECYDGTGTITITANGGTSPYKYSVDGYSWYGNNVFSGVTAGLYNVKVEDSRGCRSIDNNIELLEPDELINTSTLSGDKILLTGTGGVGGYMFTVLDPTTSIEYTINSAPYEFILPSTPNNLDYIVNISDSNGCESPNSLTIKYV